MPRQRHEPTEERRRIVGELVGRGMPLATIAGIIGITPRTLDRHYQVEIAKGADVANDQIAGRLFKQAMSDSDSMPNTAARIFWMKARGKWRDQYVEHAGPDGEALPAANTVNRVTLYLPDNGRDPTLYPPPMKVVEHTPTKAKQLAAS